MATHNMIALSTRSRCDEFGRLAIVEFGAFFFCEICNPVSEVPAIRLDDASIISAFLAPDPSGAVIDASNSASPGGGQSSLPSGESGPSVTLASLPGESSSCSDGESRPVGSGNRTVVHDDSGERTAPKRFVSGEAGVAPGPQDPIPNPMQTAFPPASANCGDASASPLLSSVDPELEAAVRALEAQWRQEGIELGFDPTFFFPGLASRVVRNTTALRSCALNSMSANLVQVSDLSSSTSKSTLVIGA